MGRRATASSECTRCTSVDLATAGNLCTTIGTTALPSIFSAAVGRLSSAGSLPFHLRPSCRFLARQRVLYFTAWVSRCSRASLTAATMSPACASPTRGPLRGLMVISALWRCFSTARITLVSNRSRRIFLIFARPVSTSLRILGVISYCLPVYSTFIVRPSKKFIPVLGHSLYFWICCTPVCDRRYTATSSLCADVCSGCAYLPGTSPPCGVLPGSPAIAGSG